MDLNLVKIVFEISSLDPERLQPGLYYALRRFDVHFKKVSCLKGDIQCHLCGELAEGCPYRSVFGQILSTDLDIVRKHQKPPLPFAFKISEISDVKSTIELSIVIVGSAIRHVTFFQGAINQMVASVSKSSGIDAYIAETWSIDYQGGSHELNLSSNSFLLLSALEIIQSSIHSETVRIKLESPLRLACRSSIAHSFDFGLLLRSQLRRCSSLFAYYGEGELELDYLFLSEAADRVTVSGNGFSFTEPHWSERAGFAGVIGTGELRNLAYGVLPLLTLGTYFNAGKASSYGMGAYRFEVL